MGFGKKKCVRGGRGDLPCHILSMDDFRTGILSFLRSGLICSLPPVFTVIQGPFINDVSKEGEVFFWELFRTNH